MRTEVASLFLSGMDKGRLSAEWVSFRHFLKDPHKIVLSCYGLTTSRKPGFKRSWKTWSLCQWPCTQVKLEYVSKEKKVGRVSNQQSLSQHYIDVDVLLVNCTLPPYTYVHTRRHTCASHLHKCCLFYFTCFLGKLVHFSYPVSRNHISANFRNVTKSSLGKRFCGLFQDSQLAHGMTGLRVCSVLCWILHNTQEGYHSGF